MFPTCKNSQKRVKNQKSTEQYSSFDGLIQKHIDLSDIYLAVIKKNHLNEYFTKIRIEEGFTFTKLLYIFYLNSRFRFKFKFKIHCTYLDNHPVLDIFLPNFFLVLVVMLFQTPVTPGVHSPQVFLKDKKKIH